MGLRLPFVLIIVVVAVIGCGAASPFGYRYYGLKPDSYKGTLEGDKQENNLPLSVCSPDAKDKNKCVVLLTRDAFRLKEEVLRLRQQLKDCQRGVGK
jgi:hypothetical protein